jgi:hypothetical protein
MKIKFNNIRDLDDARYAAAMMAEWIGFTVGYEDSLPVGKIQEIIGWCAGPKLILELHENTREEQVESYLNVLPVEGLECSAELAFGLTERFDNEGMQWIINGTKNIGESGRFFLHNVENNSDKQHIKRVLNPGTELPDILDEPANAISLNCFESPRGALKDYSAWNDFFDALELP